MPACARVLVEVDRPEEVAVVGERDGREAAAPAARSTSRSRRAAPSSRLYSEWTCRWTKSALAVTVALAGWLTALSASWSRR